MYIGEWYRSNKYRALDALPEHLRLFVPVQEAVYNTSVLPVVLGEEQWLLFGFCERGGRGWLDDPTVIYAPRVLLWIHYPSGEFRWEEPAPNAYGLPTAKQEGNSILLGPIERDHLVGNEWYEAGRAYPYPLMQVIEKRWLVTAYPTTDEERATARELQQCVRALYDKPLLPFYQHFGYRFLAWMERAAK